MKDTTDATELDSIPNAETIKELRNEASTSGASVAILFPSSEGTPKHLVVSPRGTCVVLDETIDESFNPSVSADEIVSALQS